MGHRKALFHYADCSDVVGHAVVVTALLDRLLHHAVVLPIEGNSYRMPELADLIPEHLHRSFSMEAIAPKDNKRRGPGRPRKQRQDP